jgi:serine acetyltransferase
MMIAKLYADIRRLLTLMSGRMPGKLVRLLFHPSLHIMVVHRVGHSIVCLWPPFNWLLALAYWPFRMAIRVLYHAAVPARAHIGGGCVVMQPYGIIIHPTARLGANVTLYSQVVVDVARQGDLKCADIGDEVTLQSGAKIIGPLRINHHATVCANSYIQQDVAAYAVVAGVPAHVVRMGGGGGQGHGQGHGQGQGRSNNRHRPPRRRRERTEDSNVRVYSDKREGIIHV